MLVWWKLKKLQLLVYQSVSIMLFEREEDFNGL